MMAAPRITSTTPVARFSVLGSALLANTAAMRAQIRVNTTHSASTVQSGAPPDGEMGNGAGQGGEGHNEHASAHGCLQLVAQHRGQDQQHHHAAACAHKATDEANDDAADHGLDGTLFGLETPSMASLVVITGRTMNLTPSRNVMITEKLPMVREGTRLAM